MKWNVTVEVMPRAGIADPEGATVERALPALGYGDVSAVRIGKLVQFLVEADDEVEARQVVDDMCARFLTNPVIEDATVRVVRG